MRYITERKVLLTDSDDRNNAAGVRIAPHFNEQIIFVQNDPRMRPKILAYLMVGKDKQMFLVVILKRRFQALLVGIEMSVEDFTKFWICNLKTRNGYVVNILLLT